MTERNNTPAQDSRAQAERDPAYEPSEPVTSLARAHEPGRGRDAEMPQDIPARGWRDISWRVARGVVEDRVLATAGSVAFFVLLAVFPGLATVVALYGLFTDPSTIIDHLKLLAGILPADVLALFAAEAQRLIGQSTGTLGATFLIGLAVSLWSANSGVSALFDALNVVYKEREKRSLVRFYATTLMFTLGVIAFALAALAAVIVLPLALGFIGFGRWSEQLLLIVRWPLLLGIVGMGLALLYRFGPSRREPKWRWVEWASVVAAVLWLLTSMLYSAYVANFDSYNRVYGSLGAAAGFMTWIWLSAVVVLLGAELNAEVEHQTARDTTKHAPPERPLGGRRAVMADTVGEAAS
jgi:membrane protein